MNIKELRNQLKLSQSAFAEKIGVDRSTVGHMENGRLAVSDKVADKIWEVFGVEIRDTKEKKPAKKAKAPKLVIYIQSPMGGNITPEEVAAKMPEGTEACYVRVDQNLIWWVRGDEYGSVEIWGDNR